MALSYWQSPCGLMAISADEKGIQMEFVKAVEQFLIFHLALKAFFQRV